LSKMKEIRPIQNLDATVEIPGSKSFTQRALVIAAVAEGESLLKNALISDDSAHLMGALEALGAGIQIQGTDVRVTGTGGRLKNPEKSLYLGNNGTALRLLISLVSLGEGEYTLTGTKRLCERPVGPLLEALGILGVQAKSRDGNGFPPVTVRAGVLSGGRVAFRDIVSSQFISSLMVCAPYARKETVIDLEGRILSYPYLEMTREVMESFGVSVRREKSNRFIVCGGGHYRSREYTVEGDASSASYFFLAAAVCGGRVRVGNLDPSTPQGDIGILPILERLGCRIVRGENWVEVCGGELNRGEYVFDLGNMPDMVPTLAVLSARRSGRTVIRNVSHLRLKESDRLKALATELRKLKIRAEETEDGLAIKGGPAKGALIETYDDHRIAMSFAILGLAVPDMRIQNPDCVGKSFPDFWDKIGGLYR
jgi:3-phosphoshikimate 1-carboxyvinyltransferase